MEERKGNFIKGVWVKILAVLVAVAMVIPFSTTMGTTRVFADDTPAFTDSEDEEEFDAAGFDHKKTLDSLNDGDDNPDTDLKGQDFSRIYLDMTGGSDGVDLLFIVD